MVIRDPDTEDGHEDGAEPSVDTEQEEITMIKVSNTVIEPC